MTNKSTRTKFNPLVTVVVPVYNASKYLDQGVQSLLNQTYDNVEIVLVDDKSTDNSWDICQGYAKQYENIRAYRNKKNSGGPLRGRERGIKESCGEWITFMDCDDYVTATYIENLVKATHNGKYDIAVTGHSRLHQDGTLEDFIWSGYSQTKEERLKEFYQHFLKHDFWTDPTDTVGQNLIRASVCKSTDLTKYSNLIYAEDTLLALAFLVNSENGVNFVDEHDFIWRQREGSGSHGGFSSRADQPEFFASCLELFYEPSNYLQISERLPLVSVIVPVYNVENYLEDCLNSIINQSYANTEIILVNDGSTDKSARILDRYKQNDSRISIVSQDNMGLNMARASGVAKVTGSFITFIDSDDIVHVDYIKILYEDTVKNDTDISVAAYKTFVESGSIDSSEKINVDPEPKRSQYKLSSGGDVINFFLGNSFKFPNIYEVTAWGKLYSTSIIKSTDWTMSNYRRHEDNFELLQWYSASQKGVSIVPLEIYYYRSTPGSISRTSATSTSPSGKEINYFELILELYEKSKVYLGEDKYELALIKSFSKSNRIKLREYFIYNILDTASMDSATSNIEKIESFYQEQVDIRERHILSQRAEIHRLQTSSSWKITKPLRHIRHRIRKLGF